MVTMSEQMQQMVNTYQCFIATVREDGLPSLGPKRSMRVLDGETLIYTEGTARATYANVQRFPKVAVAVVDPNGPDGFRFVGTAEVHHSGPYYDQQAALSVAQGRPKPRAAVTVRIEEIYHLKPGPTAGTRVG